MGKCTNKRVPLGYWYDENLYKTPTGTQCSLLEKQGMQACLNCPYSDCKHTSSFIHKEETKFVNDLFNHKDGRPHNSDVTTFLDALNNRGL